MAAVIEDVTVIEGAIAIEGAVAIEGAYAVEDAYEDAYAVEDADEESQTYCIYDVPCSDKRMCGDCADDLYRIDEAEQWMEDHRGLNFDDDCCYDY